MGAIMGYHLPNLLLNAKQYTLAKATDCSSTKTFSCFLLYTVVES